MKLQADSNITVPTSLPPFSGAVQSKDMSGFSFFSDLRLFLALKKSLTAYKRRTKIMSASVFERFFWWSKSGPHFSPLSGVV